MLTCNYKFHNYIIIIIFISLLDRENSEANHDGPWNGKYKFDRIIIITFHLSLWSALIFSANKKLYWYYV